MLSAFVVLCSVHLLFCPAQQCVGGAKGAKCICRAKCICLTECDKNQYLLRVYITVTKGMD